MYASKERFPFKQRNSSALLHLRKKYYREYAAHFEPFILLLYRSYLVLIAYEKNAADGVNDLYKFANFVPNLPQYLLDFYRVDLSDSYIIFKDGILFNRVRLTSTSKSQATISLRERNAGNEINRAPVEWKLFLNV